MARTEKDFLNTLETYVKITQDRLRDGRIIDAHDELGLIETMIDQRRQEVEGTAPWEKIRENRCANEIANEIIEEEPQYDRYYDGKSVEPKEDYGAEMLKKLTE
jgi:hypothetical protein